MARGHLLEFYRHEIGEREHFDYPPFKTFIKITSSGPGARTRAIFAKLAERLGIYEPVVYPSFHQPGKGLLELNLLIKLKPSDWPDHDLSNYLKILPPDYVVTVDPESIL
jgi:primosomal protein N'